jgi:patatin-like phospholipase/acyl hydrolase
MITIFNTSHSQHWGYRIADVLKAAMAAPIYFLPQEVYKGTQHNEQFLPEKTSELFIDGAVFANDPELAALWAIRMQWKKSATYNILCIGTYWK